MKNLPAHWAGEIFRPQLCSWSGYGMNTNLPFEAATVRCAEKDGVMATLDHGDAYCKIQVYMLKSLCLNGQEHGTPQFYFWRNLI